MLLTLAMACNTEWSPSDDFRGSTANLPPTVGIGYPYDGFVFESAEAIEVRGYALDDDDEPHLLTLVVASDVDGEVARPLLGLDGSFAIETTLSSGDHVLTVTVSDPSGDAGSDSVTVSVDANKAPSAPVVSIDPSSPGEYDDLQAVITTQAVDPEGADVDYAWSWTVDGSDAEVDGDTVDGKLTTVGQVWEVTVVADDGQDVSDAATASATIVAAPPEVSVAIAPDAPTIDSELTCAWSATDPYGGKVSSAGTWSVGGSDAGDASSALAGAFARGDEVACTVTAESSSGTTVATATVTIENTAPVISEVVLSPSTADETDTVSCSAAATDADGDDITWTLVWTVDGVETSDGVLTGDDFDEGQSVVCTATADDGLDTASRSSATLMISNAAPSAPTAVLSADTLVAGTELGCELAVEGSDPDPADTLTYTWAWTLDGAASGETSTSFDTSGAGAGQVVGCAITAADEAESATSATVEATVIAATEGSFAVSDADTLIWGTAGGALGQSLAVVPDVDGDGFHDVLVGAPGEDSSSGAVYLLTGADLAGGGSWDDSDAVLRLSGASNNDNLGGGRTLGGTADLDGDSVGELLLAAYGGDSGATNGGEVMLLLSGDSASWSDGQAVDLASVLVTGDTSDQLGLGVHHGDLDGDGLPELVAGAPREDNGADNAGMVVIYGGSGLLSGSTLGLSDADHALTGTSADDALGYNAVEVIGDLDGDGYAELYVGAYTSDLSASDAGAGWVVAGSGLASGDVAKLAWAEWSGDAAGDNFGYAAVGLSDVDGDGTDELAVSALYGDVDATDAGATYVWYGASVGGSASASSADLTFGGDTSSDRAGRTLAAGDVDGDGAGDLLAGGPYAEGGSDNNTGQVWLFAGTSLTGAGSGSFDGDARAVFEGDSSSDQLGQGLAVGDIDQDGFADMLLGATGDDDGSSAGGSTSIFFGP